MFWQEHVVRFVVKLLSPPVPPSYTGPGSHLVVDYTSMLCALLLGASSVDTVHILSLHGAVSTFIYVYLFRYNFWLIILVSFAF